jgi:hypothetical protein
MELNFDELLRPYVENGRTLEGQIRWLRKKGVPPLVMERALQDIYLGLHSGVAYPSGNDLDQALLQRSIELMDDETEILIQRLQTVNIPGGRMKKAWRALRGKM